MIRVQSSFFRPLYMIFPAVLFLAGCAAQRPAALRYSLWTQAQQVPGDLHLVLIWSDEFAKKSGRPAAKPELLVNALIEECAKVGSGRIASYQILESAEDLQAWISIFRPAVPVLKVNAKLESSESSGNWTISIEGRSRVQALLFDTALNDTKTSVQVSRKPQPPEPSGETFSRDLLASSEQKLCRDFATKLFARLPSREKQDTVLSYSNGKSEKMKQAYAAASAGNFKDAANLWKEESDADPEGYKASGNLSAFYEAEGDIKRALDYHAAFTAKQPKGFRSMLLHDANLERESMLKGLLALKETSVPPQKILRASATLAILPLENETNDLDAPIKLRKHLAEQAQKLGMKLVPLDAIDEALKKAGFTDAGQFRSTTVQKLGKNVGADYLLTGSVEEFRALPTKEVKATLKLLYAPDGQTAYEKTLRVAEEDKNILNSLLEKALAKAADMVAEKAMGKTLDEESGMLARRFIQAWPHFKN